MSYIIDLLIDILIQLLDWRHLLILILLVVVAVGIYNLAMSMFGTL